AGLECRDYTFHRRSKSKFACLYFMKRVPDCFWPNRSRLYLRLRKRMRITLIHNPKAGDAKHGKRQLMAALAKAGHHATFQSTKEPGLKKALKKPTDLMLAAGGDGTTAKVASQLVDSGIPLSVLPLGTANNLARALGFVASPEEIITRLEDGRKRAFDVGFAYGPWGERYFFEAAGGGLLADYVRAAKKEEKKNKTIKKLSKEQEMARHSALLCRMLHDYPARKWKIELDGKDISGRYILWEAMNIHSVGPALYLAPRAGTRDGRFDFASARRQNLECRCFPWNRGYFPAQNSALPGVRANGITSRMFGTPVMNISIRSKPRPKPECGTVP